MAAEPALEVLALEHRLASGVIPVISPLLQPDESVSGAGGQLFLRLRPENREAVITMIRRLDTAPRNLLITVRQGDERSASSREAAVSGRFPAGVGNVQIGEDPRPGSVRLNQGSSVSSNTSTQQIRVLDGHPATIFVGQQVPVSSTVVTRNGQVLSYSDLQPVETGFQVVPRIVDGERVVLQISPQQQRLNDQGIVETAGASTQVSGRIGEWIEIGQAAAAASGNTRGLLSRSGSNSQQDNSIAVRIDPAP